MCLKTRLDVLSSFFDAGHDFKDERGKQTLNFVRTVCTLCLRDGIAKLPRFEYSMRRLVSAVVEGDESFAAIAIDHVELVDEKIVSAAIKQWGAKPESVKPKAIVCAMEKPSLSQHYPGLFESVLHPMSQLFERGKQAESAALMAFELAKRIRLNVFDPGRVNFRRLYEFTQGRYGPSKKASAGAAAALASAIVELSETKTDIRSQAAQRAIEILGDLLPSTTPEYLEKLLGQYGTFIESNCLQSVFDAAKRSSENAKIVFRLLLKQRQALLKFLDANGAKEMDAVLGWVYEQGQPLVGETAQQLLQLASERPTSGHLYQSIGFLGFSEEPFLGKLRSHFDARLKSMSLTTPANFFQILDHMSLSGYKPTASQRESLLSAKDTMDAATFNDEQRRLAKKILGHKETSQEK
jgi:hypothetical protein